MSILGNDVVDVVSWWSDALANGKDDRIPAYVNRAWMFVVKCLKIAYRHGLTLKLTGHSLGGSIAKLLCLKYYIMRTVVFNAPGCGHMPGVYKDRGGMIDNINSRYGLINKVGLTLGRIHYIDVPNMAAEAQQLIRRYQVEVAKAHGDKGESWLHRELIKVEDYISAYDALSVHTNKVDIDLECMPESFSAMSPIYGLIAQRACQGLTVEKARTGLLAQTILAQHAIKHEVLTLQSARYNKLAHHPVF